MRPHWSAVLLACAACSPEAAGPMPDASPAMDAADRDATRSDAALADGGSSTSAPDAARVPDGGVPALDANAAFDAATDRAASEASATPEPPPGYPPGPYGADVGDTLTYLEWEGYVSDGDVELASELPFVAHSTADLHGSAEAFALVHVAEFYCAGCQNGAADLSSAADTILDAGGSIVEVLGSHGFFTRASREHLDAWIATYDLAVTSLIDGPALDLQTIEAFGSRETALIVETATMKIVWRETGDLGGVGPSSIDAATEEMLRLLTP